MAQQYSTHYSYSQGNSQPRSQPTTYPTDWLATEVPTASDMARKISNDSAYYSAFSEGSEDAYQNRSPATMSYGAVSPIYYEDDHLSTQQHPQPSHLKSSSTLERSNSEWSYSSHATPLSLGWSPDAIPLNSYKFVVPKGKEPYFQLRDGHWVTLATPQKVFLDSPRNNRKNEFPCLYPGCDEKIFKRPADLERHHRNVHGEPDQKDNFLCDYPPCKARGAFTRKDHFRDHLRDYHKEDLGSMKREKRGKPLDEKRWLKLQDAWIAERKIVATWWRCPKCLQRVHIAESGYNCQSCNHPCDGERADRIDAFRARAARTRDTYAAPAAASNSAGMDDVQYGYNATVSAAPATMYLADCVDCNDTGYIINQSSAGGWTACPACQPAVEQHYKVDTPWDDGNTGYANYSRYS